MRVDHNNAGLKLDKEFFLMTPPLSRSACEVLEVKLTKGIETEPVYVWDKIILDGYEKFEICTKLLIPYEKEEVLVNNRLQAIVWICKKQLEREDLTADVMRYLIGKRYIAEMKLAQDRRFKNSFLSDVKEDKNATEEVCEILGTEYGLSPDQFARRRLYVKALDKLAKTVPEVYRKVLEGSMTLSIKPTLKYSRLSAYDIKKLSSKILEKPYALAGLIRGRPVVTGRPRGRPKKEPTVIDINLVPMHDSTAEVMSLASTVPAWTKAIMRVMEGIEIMSVSDDAIAKLAKELSELSAIINITNTSLKEHKK